MSSSRVALAWSFTSQYMATVLQFVTTIVISRLLTPEEVGIYSLAATVIVLGQLLRDFGSGQYIIQEKHLKRDRIRAAFTVTLLSGWTVAIVIFLTAPYAGIYFKEPGAETVMRLLSVNFLLIPFGSITVAYLQRLLRFKKTMTIKLSGAFVGSITTMTCAFNGMSYLSMAWGGIAASITVVIVAGILRPRELPILPGLKEIPHVFSFASRMSGSTLLSQLSQVAADLIVAKLLGTAALGLMSRAQGLLRLFRTLIMQGVNPVLTPLFAEKHHAGKPLSVSYLYASTCLTGLSWPFSGVLAVLAPDLVATLFGKNWLAITPLVQIMCVGFTIRSLLNLSNHIFIATSSIALLLHRQLFLIPIGVVVLFLAAHVSLHAVAFSGVAMACVWVVVVLPSVLQLSGVVVQDLLAALKPSFYVAVSSILAVLLAVFALDYFEIEHEALRLIGGAIVGLLTYIFVLMIFNHPLFDEGQAVFRRLIGR